MNQQQSLPLRVTHRPDAKPKPDRLAWWFNQMRKAVDRKENNANTQTNYTPDRG